MTFRPAARLLLDIDCDGGLQFPVNGVFDFVGVLAVDTVLTEFSNGDGAAEVGGSGSGSGVDAALMSEYLAHNPPASLVPRLHCVCFRPVAPGAPVLPCGRFTGTVSAAAAAASTAAAAGAATAAAAATPAPFPDSEASAQAVTARLAGLGGGNALAATRAQVVALLASALGGDTLAAEYLLLNLVSRVYARVDSLPLGGVSLALSHVGKDAADTAAAVDT